MSRAVTARAFARRVDVDDPRLSPDGAWVCWVQRTPRRGHYQERIRIGRTDGSDARTVDAHGGQARGARWSPTGRRLGWVRQGRRGASLAVADALGGDARVVLGPVPAIDELAWAPSGSRIAIVGRLAAAPPAGTAIEVRGLAYKRDGIGVSQERSELHLVSLGGAIRSFAVAGTADIEHPRWSPDERHLAVRARDRGGYRSRVVIFDAASGSSIATIGTPHSDFQHLCWAPDGTALVLAGALERSFHPSILRFDLATRELVQVVDEPPCLIVDDPVPAGDGTYLVHGRERGRSGLWQLDLASGRMQRLALAHGRTWGMAVDARAAAAAQVLESSAEPPRVAIFSGADRRWTPITAPWRRLVPPALPRAKPHSTRSADGTSIDYWVLEPSKADRTPDHHPAVVLVHGGPHHDVGDEWGAATGQLLAYSGFVVAWGNPRGSTSYGRAFADAVRGDLGGAELRDLEAIVEDLSARPDVDRRRIGVCGHSHGGYVAALAAATTDAFRSVVCLAPITDLLSEWGTSDEGIAWAEVLQGGSPRDRADDFHRRSPSTHAWRTTSPTLLLHGERDERCPIGQSELLYAILRSSGVEAQLIRYPTASHDLWATPALAEDVNERIAGWFEQTLAPVPR